MAGTFASIVMLTVMLVGGFYLQVSLMPIWIRWAHYFSWMKYGYDVRMIIIFDDCLPSSSLLWIWIPIRNNSFPLLHLFQALIINEFSGKQFTQEPDINTKFDKDAAGGNISGDSILDTTEPEVNSILANLGILFLFVVSFRVLAFFLLRSSLKPKG